MKKNLKAFASLMVIFSLLLCATSCSFGDPFKKFSKKIEKEENFKMTMSMTIEDVGKITQTSYVDGNIMYYPENTALMTEEYYVESMADSVVEYRKNINNKWEKTIKENDDAFNLETNDIFNVKNYKRDSEDKNIYTQKKDVIFDNFEDVVITFYDESVVIEGNMTMEMVKYEVKIVISEIGEQQLTLPSVSQS